MKKLLPLIMTLVMIFSMSTVFAAEDYTVAFSEEQLEYIDSHISEFGYYLSDDSTYSMNDSIILNSGIYYMINGETFKTLQDRVNYRMDLAAKENLTSEAIGNITGDLQISADTTSAVTVLSGLRSLINIGLGLICVIITLLMAVYTAFDVAYIAFPVFRGKCEDAKVNGSATMTKTNANGDRKLRFVTDDAQHAISQAETEGGGSAWSIYLKSRIVAYVFVAIILFMFMTGNINIITNIALKAVSGLMEILKTLQI